MFNELESMLKELPEAPEDLTIAEDPESAVLEVDVPEAEAPAEAAGSVVLTPEENAAYQECDTKNIKQLLEQYAMTDQEVLAALELRSDTTELKEDDGTAAIRVETGKSCGSGRGCSGSTWCYGCGDLK